MPAYTAGCTLVNVEQRFDSLYAPVWFIQHTRVPVNALRAVPLAWDSLQFDPLPKWTRLASLQVYTHQMQTGADVPIERCFLPCACPTLHVRCAAPKRRGSSWGHDEPEGASGRCCLQRPYQPVKYLASRPDWCASLPVLVKPLS
jgi:hypothetical protein